MVDNLRIALLFNGDASCHRPIRRGIFRHARPALAWDFIIYPRINRSTLSKVRRWAPHGIIADLGRTDLAEIGRSFRVPVVNLYGGQPHGSLPQVGADDEAAGRMAARHLLECGYEAFGYVGFPGPGMPAARWRGFCGELALVGRGAKTFFPYAKQDRDIPLSGWSDAIHDIEGWLAGLPRPVGLFACSDLVAGYVSEACRHLGLQVPEQVGILGVDDDEDLCEGSYPALSSIRMPYEMIGRRAAQTLEDMINGACVPAEPVRLPPLQVVHRRSTDLAAVSHQPLSRAVAYIRDHAHEGIQVWHVAERAGLSRRSLERYFQDTFGRSPFQEIRRRQLEIAKRLLRETDDKLDVVAAGCGLSSAIRLGLEFREKLGTTPGQYRARFRTPGLSGRGSR